MSSGTLDGQIVDLHQQRIYPGEVRWEEGIIKSVREIAEAPQRYLLPGFTDAHVHIESSMLVPSEFARLAVRHGTVATVSDPHEIANVLGIAGVEYIIENGGTVPFHFNFGAPSCVPATAFETAGAALGPEEVEQLLRRPDIRYLAEMMNFPGVLQGDAEVMEKIRIARELGKPVDGHAPGLRGAQARQYAAAGIQTDHECFTYAEGKEKCGLGMKVLIREGSAARNFEAVIPLIREYPEQIMFCSDDKHPDSLLEGHINALVARGLREGYALMPLLRAACLHPVEHYGLKSGLLRAGDSADFIVCEDLKEFRKPDTYIKGQQVARAGESLIARQPVSLVNRFHAQPQQPEAFALPARGNRIRLIEAIDGELMTRSTEETVTIKDGLAVSDPSKDILKIAVLNRYSEAEPAVAFIRGFGLREGALASCVGHDSHNIIAVGADDESLCRAVNLIIEHRGGISAVGYSGEHLLPLPVAGIMSDADGFAVAEQYQAIDAFAKAQLGSCLGAPFMALSFMALLVIPELKLSDRGLFDGQRFELVDVFLDQ